MSSVQMMSFAVENVPEDTNTSEDAARDFSGPRVFEMPTPLLREEADQIVLFDGMPHQASHT